MFIVQLRHSECGKLFAKVLHKGDKTILSIKCPRCSRTKGKAVYANYDLDIIEAEPGSPKVEIKQVES